MKKLLAISSLLLTLAPSISMATCSSAGSCTGTVERIYTRAGGNVLVGIDGDETKLPCTAVSNVYFTLKKSSANFKELYATLLSAQISEKEVLVRALDGSPDCEVSYAFIK